MRAVVPTEDGYNTDERNERTNAGADGGYG